MELWMRERLFNFAGIIMRVPPLFVIDELLRFGLGVSQETMALNSTDYGFKMNDVPDGVLESIVSVADNSVLNQQNWTGSYEMSNSYIYSYQIYLMTALKFLACCFGNCFVKFFFF